MAKKITLEVANPCHEDWGDMTPTERGRFCGSCQKQVVDFTGMTDAQVAAFFKKPSTGSTCGRFMSDQLNREIEIPRKRIPWVKYFFQFALPAFLVSLKASAHTNGKLIQGDIIVMPQKRLMGDTTVVPLMGKVKSAGIVNGVVLDLAGRSIPGASVIQKGSKKGVAADENGKFTLNAGENESNVTLVFSAIGYQTLERVVQRDEMENLTVTLKESEHILTGDVVIIAGMVSPSKKRTIPLIGKSTTDTASSRLKVFPSPALAGSTINLECNKIKDGDYVIEIANAMGQVVYTCERRLEEKVDKTSLQLPMIKAGSYFINLRSRKGNRNYAQKIIIQ